ncbi:MAG: ATP-dependent DNA helicase RecG [Bacteroidales bacterium]
MDILSTNITYLQGVGPSKAALLNKEIGVFTYNDLLYYFPYKYIDRSKFYTVAEITGSLPYIQLKGKITYMETMGEGYKSRLVATFSDGTGSIDLVWFKGIKFVKTRIQPNKTYIIFGRPTEFNGSYNMAHPDIEEVAESVVNQAGLQAYYNTTEKMKNHFLNSKKVQGLVLALFKVLPKVLPETLPVTLIDQYKLMSLSQALREVHLPSDHDSLRTAEYRLKFEELFFIQLNLLSQLKRRQQRTGGCLFKIIGDYFNGFYANHLPFELTNAQKRVIKEIRYDVGSGKQMNRLLQGDVGSGKTLVALMSMLMALDNGFQACLMAPTEILASQHFETLSSMLGGMDIRVELLMGSTRKKQRELIHEGLMSGDLKILIGTHALLEDVVQFKNLGLAVIDEQHRFGVAQRARLWQKNETPPHVLVMTATPIPRTLAMTVYGDLDVSVIDELPPGRKPIDTIHVYQNRERSLHESMRRQLELGRQIYVVYPLIEESEALDLKNLQDGYEHISQSFPEYKVAMLHGRMKPKEKEEVMHRFAANEAQILVATTVIEVGVNVPNASVMVIENAERFGLAQLHQLRGRVGRGADQSYCILVTDYKLSEDTRKRMQTMVMTNDGFEIAEADMKLRGPGDLDGTQQSGIAFNLKIANIAKDGRILETARQAAVDLVDSDPLLEKTEHDMLRRQLRKLFAKSVSWGEIS